MYIPDHETIVREGWDTPAAEYWKDEYESARARCAELAAALREAREIVATACDDVDDRRISAEAALATIDAALAEKKAPTDYHAPQVHKGGRLDPNAGPKR